VRSAAACALGKLEASLQGQAAEEAQRFARFAPEDDEGGDVLPSGSKVDCVLPEPEPPPGSVLPKSAVVNGMNAIKPKIAQCYQRFRVPGMAMVSTVIAPDGKVTIAKVAGKFAGTDTGACVEAAVTTATFPSSKEGLTTPYPFQLK
jgi:hypothetical protein